MAATPFARPVAKPKSVIATGPKRVTLGEIYIGLGKAQLDTHRGITTICIGRDGEGGNPWPITETRSRSLVLHLFKIYLQGELSVQEITNEHNVQALRDGTPAVEPAETWLGTPAGFYTTWMNIAVQILLTGMDINLVCPARDCQSNPCQAALWKVKLQNEAGRQAHQFNHTFDTLQTQSTGHLAPSAISSAAEQEDGAQEDGDQDQDTAQAQADQPSPPASGVDTTTTPPPYPLPTLRPWRVRQKQRRWTQATTAACHQTSLLKDPPLLPWAPIPRPQTSPLPSLLLRPWKKR